MFPVGGLGARYRLSVPRRARSARRRVTALPTTSGGSTNRSRTFALSEPENGNPVGTPIITVDIITCKINHFLFSELEHLSTFSLLTRPFNI